MTQITRYCLAFLLCAGLLAASSAAQAAIYILKGKGGETITLESAPELGADMYLIKIDGADTVWSGKVFAVKKKVYGESDRYGFDYTVDLSSGPQAKSYQVLVETDGTLQNGSIADTYDLYVPEVKGVPLEFVQDLAASHAYEKGSLGTIYKQQPFKPVVE